MAIGLGSVAILSGCSSTGTTAAPTTTNAPGATTGSVPSSSPGSSPSSAPGSTPGTAALTTLRVLVTNDDGVGAPGIDAVVEALRKEPDVEVTVVAPATNQSGTGGKTSTGPVGVTDATTVSGYPAKAVAGFPADTVIWAMNGGIDFKPDLVVSGNNAGQNLGPLVNISGTVGAARAAANLGIPAVAVSQGIAGGDADYASGVTFVIGWLHVHRGDLAAHTNTTVGQDVVSFNVPTCTAGKVRGLKEVPVAKDLAGRDLNKVDCTSTATAAADDIDAFAIGFATQSAVSATAPPS